MATSISKAQAEAIASGFFNESISEEKVSDHFKRTKKGLVPKHAFSKLIEMAGFLAGDAQENLVKSDRVASGSLSESIKVINPKVINGVVMSVSIEALEYWAYVDGGVKGTKSGSGVFAFKNNFVGKKMFNSIKDWVIEEGIKGKTDKYTGISKRDDFRKTISDPTDGLAWAIAKNIKKKGLKRTNFFANAVKDTRAKVKRELGKAFAIDIIQSLPKKL